jgi:hypothetical protein
MEIMARHGCNGDSRHLISQEASEPGAALGLENDWLVHVLKTTRNYGEIYGRAFGDNSDRALPQDLNQIGSSGALMNFLSLK